MCLTSARQDERVFDLDRAHPPFSMEFMQGVSCLSIFEMTHKSDWERNKFSSFTQMGSTLNHSSWQDHASCWHFRKLWKKLVLLQWSPCLSLPSSRVQPWGRPRPAVPEDCCWLTDRRRGRPGEEPAAMLMQSWLSDATVTLPPRPAQCAQGRARRFLSLPQAAFIFHTTGNWTLSSVTESLGCTAYLCMGNWLLWFSVLSRITVICDGPTSHTWRGVSKWNSYSTICTTCMV